MCGIVGIAGHTGERHRVLSDVEAMAQKLAHRGPDGGGAVYHQDLTLAMRRLAVVDIEHGHQPMLSEDGTLALVFNGEIYNAPELRSSLARRGVAFQTRSDTEVILRLYEDRPDEVEEHLRGMWAFAIHDRRRRGLILSRDRFGMKPLFWVRGGGMVAFASELRCFDRAMPSLSSAFTIDPSAAHALHSFSVVPCEDTIFRGVKRVPPASRLTVDLDTCGATCRRYWELTPSADASRVRSLNEASESVDFLLRRSVREHLESDVPVAMFLSGGIDSSLVASYARDTLTGPIQAYSVGFAEPRFDESPFAQESADRIGVPLRVSLFDESAAIQHLPDALLAYDEPFGDSSSLATYMLTRVVGADFKVALAGDGGDEVFAGYSKYQLARFRRLVRHVPHLRDFGARVLSTLPGQDNGTMSWGNLLPVLRRRSRGFDGSDAHVYARLTQFAPLQATAPLIRQPTEATRYIEALRTRFERATGSELQRTLSVDLQSSLTNDMLVKVDRASMARHLEVRMPFLDHRVVEYGVGLPERFVLGFQGKRVLRKLHRDVYGAALANRPKRGFSVPLGRWLRGPFDGACRRIFSRERLDRFDLLSSDELSDGRHLRWLDRDPAVVWHAFALAAWCESTLGGGPDAVRDLIRGTAQFSG